MQIWQLLIVLSQCLIQQITDNRNRQARGPLQLKKNQSITCIGPLSAGCARQKRIKGKEKCSKTI